MRNTMQTQTARWLLRSFVLCALLFGLWACSEGAGTKREPGLFPPEAEIDRSRHQVDAGETGDGDSGDGDSGDGDTGDGDADAGGDGDMGDGDMGDGDGTDEDAGI